MIKEECNLKLMKGEHHHVQILLSVSEKKKIALLMLDKCIIYSRKYQTIAASTFWQRVTSVVQEKVSQ